MRDQNTRWLKNKCHTTEGPYLLPFAPNTRWRRTSIFIVGLNPIACFREEFKSFNHYWAALTRYPEIFHKIYQAKYLKGQDERSRTSSRIREMVDYLQPLDVLVTNVFAYPTTNPLHIPKAIKREPIEETILSALLIMCKPKVVLFHGAEARKFGEQFFNVELNPYIAPLEQKITGIIRGTTIKSQLFTYHHFVGRVEPKETVTAHIKQFAIQIRHVVEKR